MDIHPSVAVTLPSSLPAREDAHWEEPRTQEPPEHRERLRASRRRSPNHVRAIPANPAVISSILDSFDTLTPPVVHANERCLETSSTGSKSSRRYSDDATVSSTPSIKAGFGMEIGKTVSARLEEEESPTNAAPPPSIRTSRPPSGLSNYAAPFPNRLTAEASGSLRAASIASRRSSWSGHTKETGRVPRNKHSAESWIRQNSLSKDSAKGSPGSLRRVTSQHTLRPPKIDESHSPVVLSESSVLSRAELIIAKTPPPLQKTLTPSNGGKGRLYLTDSVSEEQVATDSPHSTPRTSELGSISRISETANINDQSSSNLLPQRISPRKSPIVDSIPTRTSSLRQTSSSPAGRKRDKKSKRQTVASGKLEGAANKRSNSIPESSWADLGDDDETVKRIRQLREQRRSRIEESKQFSTPEIPQSNKSEVENTPAPDLTAWESEENKRASRIRPAANRAFTEPPSKAHRLLGLQEPALTPRRTGSLTRSVTEHQLSSNSAEKLRHRPQSLLEEKALVHTPDRPNTASPPTPPLSLDYSYAQIVDALHGVEHELSRNILQEQQPSKTSVESKSVDLPPLARPEVLPSPIRPRPQSTGRRPDRKSRLAGHHPDLPLEILEKRKDRRKSISDARRMRHNDDGQELQQRDSIEDSVQNYLRAPRLSRKVKHPQSGRVISFSEVGDPEGAAVFICVGMGLTRYVTAFYDELATTLRLRLITVDRPGVGGSEPYPPSDRSGPLSWPDDVLAICQQLGISEFSLLAHSAGAIYALATALILPHLVKGKVHLLAPWIPPSQLETVRTTSTSPAVPLPRSQRILRVLPSSFLKAANSSFMTATSSSLKPASKRQLNAGRDRSRDQSLSPSRAPEQSVSVLPSDQHRRESMMLMDQFMPTTNPMENFPIPIHEEDEDKSLLKHGPLALTATATPIDPNFVFAATALNAAEHTEKLAERTLKERRAEYTARLTQRTWDLATRDSNPATDLLVCLERHRGIGFRYTDVVREIVITHGSEDKRVPLGNVKWLAQQINARALAGVAGDLAGDSVPQSRDGWADDQYSRGGCEVRILEGEGHGLMASAPIMSDILTEIAGYWTGHARASTAV
ncbi:hypothetical protein M433DRAFT_153095 [Acidomyces richmondensis BFW]|nr:MAG: hypothetical protein FE78DRAFT_87660 [Acidomyces sp. 'richmondensis']KYG46683.1 hypothetical protein M433DRAFT_153095 [Acidomyces richmondensis BFW]